MARLYAFVRSAAICFIALTALPGAVARADEGTLLKGEGIRETVSGKRIYLAIPFGGGIPALLPTERQGGRLGRGSGAGAVSPPSDWPPVNRPRG